MKTEKNHGNTLLLLLLFALFAFCLLALSLGGAGVYRAVTERGSEVYESRTVGQYLATRVRQAEELSVASYGDGDALCLREDIGDRAYVTYIYCHDGWLCELFTAEDSGMGPEDGEKLLELSSLSIRSDEKGLTLQFGEEAIFLARRQGREVAA